MRCAHTVKVELLEYLHIASYGSLVHSVPQNGVLHVRVLGVYLERLAVQIEHAVTYLGLLESHALYYMIHSLPIGADEVHREVIELRGLGGPFLGSLDLGGEVDGAGAILYVERSVLHTCNLTTIL